MPSPAALHLDIGFINPPQAVGWAQVGPQPLLQFHGVGLDPAVDGRVVDRHAPVPQHQFEVAVGDRELQVPAHRITSDVNCRPVKGSSRLAIPDRYAPDVSNPALLPDQPAAAILATELPDASPSPHGIALQSCRLSRQAGAKPDKTLTCASEMKNIIL